jgi:hypothetical protein
MNQDRCLPVRQLPVARALALMSLLVSGCAAPSDATTGAGAAPLPVLAGAVGTDSSTPASDFVLSPTPPAAAAAAPGG